jgi:hypothetical protein
MLSVRAMVALVLAAALLAGPMQPVRASQWPADAVPGALLVTAETPAALATLPDARPVGERVGLVRVSPGSEMEAARRLARLPGVVAVEPDRLRTFASVPDDPEHHRQWAHRLAGIDKAWSYTTGSWLVRVALIDSGIRGDHPDLRANVVEQVDVASGTVRSMERGVDNDTCELGHGTRVAGVIGAVGNNGIDIAGVAWDVGLVDIAVSSAAEPHTCETIPDSAVLAGMHYATTRPGGAVDVINLSLGSPQGYCPEAYHSAVRAARARGVVVVVAAGNLGPGGVSVPAACPGVLGVTALDQTGGVAEYAATNPWVSLAAPGGADRAGQGGTIITTSREGGTEVGSGTSFAAAHVTGTVALLRDLRPDLTPNEVRSVLQASAGQLDADHGIGSLQADRALEAVLGDQPVPSPEPVPFFPVLRLADPPAGPGPIRVDAGEPTDPIVQAVAVSRAVFKDRGAAHVVLSRSDGFADGLAGSALGYGMGPLLFTGSQGPLAAPTELEMRRVLPSGGTVYLLGGERAIPAEVEAHLVDYGYVVERLSGRTREETAARIAVETRERIAELGFTPPSAAILVTRGDWPDAITAGSLGAVYGIPILLTEPDRLHPATEGVLFELQPEQLFVVGGTASVSTDTARAAALAAGEPTVVRLAGPARDQTALAVARQLVSATAPRYAVAINVRRADGYAAALAATAVVGTHRGVFVPVEGEGGTILTEATRDAVRGLGLDAILVGGRDLVSPEVGQALQTLLDE